MVQYSLGDQEGWPENGSPKYTTLLQLDLFCKREEKWEAIPYVQCFMALSQDESLQRKRKLTKLKTKPSAPKGTISPVLESPPGDKDLLYPAKRWDREAISSAPPTQLQ